MYRTLASLALLAFLAGNVTTLEAQARRGGRDRGLVELSPEKSRSGFFISGAVGAGAEQNKFSDDLQYTQSLTKPTLMLRLGGTPNAGVRLGAEFFGWWNAVADGTETFGTALVMAQFYPAPKTGLYLKVGGGIAESGIDFTNGSSIHETGFGWSVGAGYDLQLSPQFSLGPTVDFYKATFTKRNQATLSERVVNIGIQVSFQTGGRRR